MLRLDDTDTVRSTEAFAKGIEQDFAWFGLNWDLFARQSDRYGRYEEVLEKFKREGRAYACFETQDELALKRKSQLARGLPPLYDRAALKLTADEIKQKIAAGQKPHWRFKLNDMPVIWDDLVQGNKEFSGAALSDPVLMREDGVPLYTYASAVDDTDFQITHIIRGEDHVANTAVQLQIFEALGAKPPTFAHLPLLQLASGEELSKRLGSMSVEDLRNEGIEPLALASLLARMGTSDAVEAAADMQELIQHFDFKKIGRSPPKFDMNELKRLNARVLHHMDFATAQPHLKTLGLTQLDEKFWLAVRGNLEKLNDAKEWWDMAQGLVETSITDPEFIKQAAALLPSEPWDNTSWKQWTDAVKKATGRGGKDLFQPLRLALTGKEHGPEMKNLLPLIGHARAQARLTQQK